MLNNNMKWPRSSWKDVQHHASLEKWKLKPQGDTTSCPSGRPLSQKQKRKQTNKKKRKTGNNKCWQGCGEIKTLARCWWECKGVQLLWKRERRFPPKLNIELSHDSVTPHLGVEPNELRARHQEIFARHIQSGTVHHSWGVDANDKQTWSDRTATRDPALRKKILTVPRRGQTSRTLR